MKKTILLAVSLVFALTLSACGGGSGGGGAASVTCAPSTKTPVANVTGNWQIAVTNINNNCPSPPNWITCNVAMSQASDGNVTVTPSGNCSVNITIMGVTATSSDYTSISSAGGAVDGNNFYWVGTLGTSISVEGFTGSETDTIACDTISNFANGSTSQVTTTATYNTSAAGEGSCTGTATVTFTQT